MVTLSIVGLPFLACATRENAAEIGDTWVGTITTEGNVTTVVNESGSVWGGTAALVEEASIGVEAGEDAYMFGQIGGLAFSGERIYVADRQVPALRAYARNGEHLMDIGHEGSGPGEFRSAFSVGVDDAGRVWLDDASQGRVLVYSAEGQTLATLPKTPPFALGPMVVTPSGRSYVFSYTRGPDSPRWSMIPYDLDGPSGPPLEIPEFERPPSLVAETPARVAGLAVPFSRRGVWSVAPTPAVVSGHPDRYRFQVDHADGRRLVVERSGAMVDVDPNEASAHRRAATEYLRLTDPGWAWPDERIPDTKPAYTKLLAAMDGSVWVIRDGAGSVIPGCDEHGLEPEGIPHCWKQDRIVEAFGPDGKYLGTVSMPGDVRLDPPPAIHGDGVVAMTEDDLGTIMVKRYRLVLPEEEGH